jgi:cell division septum initiation protein DivIVA
MEGNLRSPRSLDPSRTVPSFQVVRRGFDQEQVLAHLRLVRARVTDLESRLNRALRDLKDLEQARTDLEQARTDLEQARIDLERSRGEVEELQRERDVVPAADRDPYEGVSEHVMELVRGFDRDVERSKGRAELVASGIVAEARTEAARKRIEALAAEREARAQAERLLNEAQEEAANLRAEMAPLREWTLSQAQAIRDRMRMSLLELEAVMPSGSDEDPVIVVGEALEERKPPVP